MKKKRSVTLDMDRILLSEKRRSRRLRIPLKIEYATLSKTRSICETICSDISGGGIGIISRHPLKKGEKVRTLLYSPEDKRPVEAMSVVTRCRKTEDHAGQEIYDIGLKHVTISKSDQRRFLALLMETFVGYFLLDKKKK